LNSPFGILPRPPLHGFRMPQWICRKRAQTACIPFDSSASVGAFSSSARYQSRGEGNPLLGGRGAPRCSP